MKIYIENSSWNNIGDFFYQNSIYEIFKKIFNNHLISCFDAPTQRSFKIKKNNFFYKNIFELKNFIDGDVYVLSGPILGRGFVDQYGDFIEKIFKTNKKYMILSAHGHDIYENKKILEKFPPLAISTRSRDTYEIYKDFTNNCYDGICNAFYLPLYSNVPELINKKYIIKSFYSMFEPDLSFKQNKNKIDLNSIHLKFKKYPFGKLSRHAGFLIRNNDNYKDYETIRLNHDLSYKFHHLNFAKKNSYISYNILNYLSIYKNSKLIVSDRVHSVVLGLAYGVPSMLCGKWDRSNLFDRVKLEKVNNFFLAPKKEFLINEHEKYIQWLLNIFN